MTMLACHRLVLLDLRHARRYPAAHLRDLHPSRQYRDQHSLLVNDSLIIAALQREHIQLLATNDPDFERIPGIGVRLPTTA
jgi:predicted nucleic acid-binding protein